MNSDHCVSLFIYSYFSIENSVSVKDIVQSMELNLRQKKELMRRLERKEKKIIRPRRHIKEKAKANQSTVE